MSLQELRFKVNLLHEGNTHQSADDVLNVARTKTLYIPMNGGSLPARPMKHGDEFTLTGISAYRLKSMIESGILNYVAVVESPVQAALGDLRLCALTPFGFNTMNFVNGRFSIAGLAFPFDKDELEIFDLDDIGYACFTSDGESTYVILNLENGDFRFFKVDAAGEITLIGIPDFDIDFDSRNYISDGLDDMYDSGNYLNTNLAIEIAYTHSPNSNDGEIVDSDSKFGSGSQYFTNNNGGIFSLVATGISIDSFYVSGNLGADGSGNSKHGRLVVSVGGSDYSVFYRCVYDSGDLSVNQMIIIPGDHDLTHTVGESTDNDQNTVEGLDVVNRLAYILFATSGSEVDESVLENVAESFISGTSFGTASISDIKSSLNTIESSLVSEISDLVQFDDGDGSGTTGGLEELNALIYIGDGKLALLDNDIYRILDKDTGEVLLERQSDAFQSFERIVYYQGQVYGFGYGNVLYKLDKDTGEVFGEGDLEDKKSNILSWKVEVSNQFTIDSIRLPFVYNERLFAIAQPNDFDEGWYSVIEIFPETNEIDWICNFRGSGVDNIAEVIVVGNESDEIGFASEFFTENYAWYYDGVIYIREDRFTVTPTIENLVVEWVDENDFWSDDDGEVETDWASVEITGVEYNESDHEYEISFTEPEGDYILRMRYADGSRWLYVEED